MITGHKRPPMTKEEAGVAGETITVKIATQATQSPTLLQDQKNQLKKKRSLILIRKTMLLKILKKKKMIKQQKQVQMKMIPQIQASKDSESEASLIWCSTHWRCSYW